MGRRRKGPHDAARRFKIGDKVWLYAGRWEILGKVIDTGFGTYTVRLKRTDGITEDTKCTADWLRPA